MAEVDEELHYHWPLEVRCAGSNGKLGKGWENTPYATHAWYIYLQNWVIVRANIGKYSSTMEQLGTGTYWNIYENDGPTFQTFRVDAVNLACETARDESLVG